MILGLQNLGINAGLKRKEIKKPDPYFCFVNPSKYDVVEAERKIAMVLLDFLAFYDSLRG